MRCRSSYYILRICNFVDFVDCDEFTRRRVISDARTSREGSL